ncbi:heme-binding protein soul2 [Denticeps clupeoides]|uniref:Heme-binding protein 2-like n=1 Tax=Denticeps clupeoides TaxID=299321 RepID=A0AAY4E5R0_9TELE|nr:heme-binding protein 2-like [Denticeps clupeoides]
MKLMKLQVAVTLWIYSAFSGPAAGWEIPSFCHGYDCPEFTLVQQYEGFEERFYNASHWITVDIPSMTENDVKNGCWTLHHYTKGKNDRNEDIQLPWPVIISVQEGTMTQVSVSMPVPPSTDLPKPDDESIRETNMPAGRVYVRTFTGVASLDDGFDNRNKLKASLEAAGKQFVQYKFVAAGYDSPWTLINRHNEIWIYAA